MATIKSASKHRRRQDALFLGLCMIAAPFMFVMISWIESSVLLSLIGLLVAVVMLAILVTVTGKWNKAFRCPDCGGAVAASLDTKGEESAPILRLCPRCDVLWQTGVTVAD